MADKICPLLSKGPREYVSCLRGKCAFWVSVYTTESLQTSGCAISFMPSMNMSGRLQV